MAPIETAPGQARPVFERTRDIFEELKSTEKDPSCWDTLSMGMSGDYEAAIACGANIVRVGTTIFGARHYPAAKN